jgi:hypothetical protein
MTPKEILETLRDLEEATFYGMHNPKGISFDTWTEVHELVKKALIEWHRETGLKTN